MWWWSLHHTFGRGRQAPKHTGPIHYVELRNPRGVAPVEFDGMAVTSDESCSFGFVRPSGEVVRWDWFDFREASLIGWREEGDSILVEIANTKATSASKTGEPVVVATHRLVRFLDGPDGMIKEIIDQAREHSRFNLEERVGDESSVQGLNLLPNEGT